MQPFWHCTFYILVSAGPQSKWPAGYKWGMNTEMAALYPGHTPGLLSCSDDVARLHGNPEKDITYLYMIPFSCLVERNINTKLDNFLHA